MVQGSGLTFLKSLTSRRGKVEGLMFDGFSAAELLLCDFFKAVLLAIVTLQDCCVAQSGC